MNDILQKTPGESPNNLWLLPAPILPTEYTETPEEPQAAKAWESVGNLAAEAPPPIFESAAQFDPYAGIRPALSPEHAALTADEITAVLGPRPAIIALHEL